MQEFNEPMDACKWAEDNLAIVGKAFSASTKLGYVTVYRRPDAPIYEWSYGYDGAYVAGILNLL